MDDKRFDALVRSIGKGASRRSILKGILGLGGAAAVGGTILADSDARTTTSRPRIPPPPTRTPTPVVTPTRTPTPTPDPCPAPNFRCGLDCCADELQCCDGECCPEGTACLTKAFYGESPSVEEENCCHLDQTCDGQCCAGTCFWPLPGEVGVATVLEIFDRTCCPDETGFTFCPGEGSFSGFGLCCSDETPDCCHHPDGGPICLTTAQCCTNDECPGECEVCDENLNRCAIDPTCTTTTTAAATTTTAVPATTTTTAAPACLAVQSVCDAFAPTCCQDVPTACSFEANCTTTQGEARCCRPIGQACSVRCDCCDNADCAGGTCQLDTGQQCESAGECAGTDPDCCSGTCRDLDNDVNNCGGCGFDCPDATNPGEIVTCIQGSCGVACADGFTLCGVFCVSLDDDPNNCGTCGNDCDSAETCCFGACRNLLTDESNCGECGDLCPGTCCGGECEDLLIDELNCGACGHNCFFELCGGSTSCPDLVVTCCDGDCVDLASDVLNCNECGRDCPLGHNCIGGVCLVN